MFFDYINDLVSIDYAILYIVLHSLINGFLISLIVYFNNNIRLEIDNYEFVIIGLITSIAIIIYVIKGSIALSLGLVGALSIVRFRTPIKNSSVLIVYFVAIGCGIAIGTQEYLVAYILSLTLFIFSIILKYLFREEIYILDLEISKNESTNNNIEYLYKMNIFNNSSLISFENLDDKLLISMLANSKKEKLADVKKNLESKQIKLVNISKKINLI